MSTKGQTVAVRLTGKNSWLDTTQLDPSDVSQYARIQFFQETINQSKVHTGLPAVPGKLCREFFASEIEAEQGKESSERYFDNIFPANEQWICPDVESIDVWNGNKVFEV